MKGRLTSSIFALTILLSIFTISFASAIAASDIQIASIPSSITQNQGSFPISFTVTNSGSTGEEVALSLTLTTGTGSAVITSPVSPVNIGADASQTVVGTVSFDSGQSGVIAGKLTVDPVDAGSTVDKAFSVDILDTSSLSIKTDQDITLGQNGEITVQNTGNKNLNLKLTSSGDFSVVLSKTTLNSFGPGAIETGITVTPTSDLSTLKFGTHSVTITATDAANSVQAASTTVSFAKSFCRNGPQGSNLTIDRVKISGSGDSDDEWSLLDTVEIEVKVANDGNADIKDVFVEMGLFDSNGKDQVSDLVFDNTDEEKIDAGRIRDGDDTTVTFSFKVPADFEDGSYKLAIKAFSDDLGEKVECVDSSDDLSDETFDSIDVIREDTVGKFIAFDNIIVEPDQAVCGDIATVTADVVNVGDEDQDQVKVNLYSTELGITPLENIIREDLNQGDEKQVTFTFTVPNGLQDKLYRLQLNANYDYRNGAYDESSDDPTELTLRVLGCSAIPGSSNVALVSASLGSDAQAGKPLVVKATITSQLPGENDIVIRPTGFEPWATLSSVSDRIVHLSNGQSKEITLEFNVNEDAAGEQGFSIETISSGKTDSQDVTVNIKEPVSSIGLNLGGNSLIWIIGAINVVLIILIIIVAVRVSKR